jgi:6-phosphogluconolactonase
MTPAADAPSLVVHPADRFALAAAERCADLARQAIAQRGAFHVALTGGDTPRETYRRLAELHASTDLRWDRWHCYLGDERCVPADHADSNWRMARETLLDRVPVPDAQIHPMVVEPDQPARDADRYQALLRASVPEVGGWPALDLVLLGVGTDGHVASLFPETTALSERDRAVVSVYVPRLDAWRVTLTLPVLNRARRRLVLATGGRKAQIVAAVLGQGAQSGLPAALLAPGPGTEWHLDREAAGGFDQ